MRNPQVTMGINTQHADGHMMSNSSFFPFRARGSSSASTLHSGECKALLFYLIWCSFWHDAISESLFHYYISRYFMIFHYILNLDDFEIFQESSIYKIPFQFTDINDPLVNIKKNDGKTRFLMGKL